MLEITERAATVIVQACDAQEIGESGGLRIAPKTAVHDGSLQSLVVEFVDRPRASDTVLRAGPATVFLADGVAPVVEGRVLDADHDGTPPRFALRARRPPSENAPA
jgi:Fe-S cluster assembly iron-binding protein IscA